MSNIDTSLIRLGRRRQDLTGKLTSLDVELGRVLTEAQSRDDITVSEAARIAGLGRSQAYKLMRKSGRSDDT